MTFNANTKFVLPAEFCCNCGRNLGIQLIEMEQAVSERMSLDEERVCFLLHAPFCNGCAVTAGRKRLPRIVLALGALMLTPLIAMLLLSLSTYVSDEPLVKLAAFFVAAGTSLFLVILMFDRRRPEGEQTSYYQPVAASVEKTAFIGDRVTRVRMLFSSQKYADEFMRMNQANLAAGGLSVSVKSLRSKP